MAIITNHDVGDYLYPSDNQYDIPCLLLDGQAGALELPFAPVGAGYKTSSSKTLSLLATISASEMVITRVSVA